MSDLMTCERFSDLLMAYLEHETNDADRAAIERHSITCPECGPVLADLRKLRIDAANLPTRAPSRDLWAGIAQRIEAPVVPIGAAVVAGGRTAARRGPARRWWMGAAAAAALVAAAGLGYGLRGAAPAVTSPEPVAADVNADAPRIAVAPPAVDSTPVVVARAPDVPPAPEGPSGSPRQASTAPAPAASVPARAIEVQLAVATLTSDYDREIARLRALIDQRRNQMDSVTVAIIEKNLAVIDTAIAESKRAIAQDPSSRFLIEFLNQSLQTKMELMRTAALLPSRI